MSESKHTESSLPDALASTYICQGTCGTTKFCTAPPSSSPHNFVKNALEGASAMGVLSKNLIVGTAHLVKDPPGTTPPPPGTRRPVTIASECTTFGKVTESTG